MVVFSLIFCTKSHYELQLVTSLRVKAVVGCVEIILECEPQG